MVRRKVNRVLKGDKDIIAFELGDKYDSIEFSKEDIILLKNGDLITVNNLDEILIEKEEELDSVTFNFVINGEIIISVYTDLEKEIKVRSEAIRL